MPPISREDSSPSFFAFARQHTFVALFGVVLPTLVFCTFVGYPIVYTIYLSFFDWNGMTPTKQFVGLSNCAYLVETPDAQRLQDEIERAQTGQAAPPDAAWFDSGLRLLSRKVDSARISFEEWKQGKR